MKKDTIHNLLTASVKNDTDTVKELLVELNLRKKPGLLHDIFGKFKYLGQQTINYGKNKEKNESLMFELFSNAVHQNNIQFCKYLIESKELNTNLNINSRNVWIYAIDIGDIEFIKYLTTNPKFKEKKKAKLIIEALEFTDGNKNLDVLKYLIDDQAMPHHAEMMKEIRERYRPKSPLTRFNLFSNACKNNNKEWVDFLLNHSEYKQMVNQLSFFNGIKLATSNNHVDLLNYLLTDKNMPFKPYEDYDPKPLLRAFNHNSIQLQNTSKRDPQETLRYLVFDFKIEKPENIDEFLNEAKYSGLDLLRGITQNEYEKLIEKAKEFFEQREFVENLDNNLKKNTGNSRRMKI